MALLKKSLKRMIPKRMILQANEAGLANPNIDGNELNQRLLGLDNLSGLTPEEENKRNELKNRFRQKLLSNTEAAAKQEASKQTIFGGGSYQMALERKKLLGI